MIQQDYAKLLHTREWKSKREVILKRDLHKCTCCGKETGKLIVHHKFYMSYPNGIKIMPWEYPDSALTTLCYKCHCITHLTTRIVVRYIPYK